MVRKAVREAADELAGRDPVLASMLDQHGAPDLRRGGAKRSHFAELARMVCYQQLAGRAAATIHGRFVAIFDGAEPTPAAVLATPLAQLRGAGLSGAKAASILDLAEKVETGVVELDRVARLPDDELIRDLVWVRGIGAWTAHMFVMFQVGRRDVWPTGDLGVRAGYGRMYGWTTPPTPKQLAGEGDQFRPYRSLVAWWCWRACDTVTPD